MLCLALGPESGALGLALLDARVEVLALCEPVGMKRRVHLAPYDAQRSRRRRAAAQRVRLCARPWQRHSHGRVEAQQRALEGLRADAAPAARPTAELGVLCGRACGCAHPRSRRGVRARLPGGKPRSARSRST